MSNTREKILKTLLSFPGSTINDLSEAVGINNISVRHHITSLEKEDLVISSEERHGVGRPRLTYTLSDKGIEKFPTQYLKLTRRLLDYLRDNKNTSDIEEMFRNIGKEIADSYVIKIGEKSLDEKVHLVKSILTDEGYIIELKKNEDSYTLTSLSCPYLRVRQDYPELCSLSHSLISELLSQTVNIISCRFEGDDHCIYQIPIEEEQNPINEESPDNIPLWDIETTNPNVVDLLEEGLSEIVDPELGLNIVQLGLVRNINIENNQSMVTMILTTPFCPYGPSMLEKTRKKVESLLGMPTTITYGHEPWDPTMMEEGLSDDWGLF